MPKKPTLLIAFAGACLFGSTALAQDGVPVTVTPLHSPLTEPYHPSWSLIPQVKRPTFDYGEVRNSKLLAEASESLNYLPIDNFLIGRTRSYQVITPDGQVFFVDNIQAPKCGVQIVAQQINTQQPGGGYQLQPIPGSQVTIGEIDFSTCY